MTDETKTALLSKLRAPVADERVSHHDQPQQTGVGEWCAPGPAAEQRRAWLLRFADTDRGDCVYYDEQEARRAFAQAEGRGWNCYLFEYARRATLASAPVAGEAQPVGYVEHSREYNFHACPVMTRVIEYPALSKLPNGTKLYAAPQASEAVRDALQKLVDMYVLNQGSDHEHITCYTPLPASHLTPKQRAKSETWKAWDDARAALSAQPGAQKNCNCATCRPHSVEMRMILCEVCGDKRCPHAADHRNECKSHPKQHNDGGADA